MANSALGIAGMTCSFCVTIAACTLGDYLERASSITMFLILKLVTTPSYMWVMILSID